MHVINVLIPVFLIIAVGALLRKTNFLTEEWTKGLVRLVYWVGLPSLLFYKIATASYDYRIAGKTYAVVMAGMIACITLGYIVAVFLRIPGRNIGSFVQGSFRGNTVFIGLPILIYSFGENAGPQAIAVLVIALIVPAYNLSAIIMLLASQHKIDRTVPVKIAKQIITNPLIIATIAGLLYAQFFSQMPFFLSRTCTAMGQMALPLALLGIGAALVQEGFISGGLLAIAASIIKIAMGPLVGFAVAKWMGLGANETRIALIFLACPTAAASYVLTDQLGGDRGLSAKIVATSSVLSIISLSVVLALV